MERIILTEADADEFLESIGVTLYENSITIDGVSHSGSYGQFILEYNGITLYNDFVAISEAWYSNKSDKKGGINQNTPKKVNQSEEYLAKKQADIDAQKADVERRYGTNPVHDPDGMGYEFLSGRNAGSRTGQTPSFRSHYDYDRDTNSYKEIDKKESEGVKSHDYVGRNPRFQKVEDRRERMETLSKKYPDAMPKNTRNAEDEAYDRAVRKRNNEIKYADKIAHKYAPETNIHTTYRDGSGHIIQNSIDGSQKYDIATDAARRHYRRTHKNEATNIFSSINFI